MPKLIHSSLAFRIEVEEPWLFVNDRRYGFKMVTDEGRRLLVCHRKRVGKFAKEIGFYVPLPLLKLAHLWEVKERADDSLVHYLYLPDAPLHRLIRTRPEVFISVATMEVTAAAPHIPRPRRLPLC